MQYENNLRKNVFYREREKKNKIFKKPFSKRYIEKGGRIIRVVLYSGQYGNIVTLLYAIAYMRSLDFIQVLL